MVLFIVRVLFLTLFLFLLLSGKAMFWLVLFALSLFAALLFGRVYCGYVCPINTLMGPVDWLSKKLKLRTTKTPKWLENGYFAWIALGASVVAVFLTKRLLHVNLPFLPLWLLIALLVTLRFKPAVFHNLICPFGALQRVVGRFARFSHKVDQDTCIGCKLCGKVCPSDAITFSSEQNKAMIKTSLCHQCTKCMEICPKKSIHYCK